MQPNTRSSEVNRDFYGDPSLGNFDLCPMGLTRGTMGFEVRGHG
jgi:hypothetical protein